MHTFPISKVSKSKLSEVDFDNLPFGKTFSDHMFVADFKNGEWTNMGIVPVADLSIHPGNCTLHYGQSIFEGMKAFKNKDGEPVMFRPEMNARRMNASARRMCMAEIPEDIFLEALHQLVDLEKDWIPSTVGSSLYLRPFMFGTDEYIGVHSSACYKFIIMALPVGPYYSKPVSLKVEETYLRAAVGGVGEAKTAGNYAASLYPAQLAKEEGYDNVMWMDGKEFKYVQEVGTMNIFFVIGESVVTPSLNGAILHGITRDSMITYLKDQGYNVEERDVSIDEIVAADKAGTLKEIFGTGTAAVVSYVNKMAYRDHIINIDPEEYKISPMFKEYLIGLRSGEIADTRDWMVTVKSSVMA